MKNLFAIIFFTCAWLGSQAQVNYVKNPDFEQLYYCPNNFDEIQAAKYWNAVDSVFSHYDCSPEYCNVCGTTLAASVPNNGGGYQYPHSGNGMAATVLYCDEIPIPPPPYYYYRDYLQGKLYKKLELGKKYCVSFWINLGEGSGYAHNKIGAYLDDGTIDTVSICSKPITFVTPQIYSDVVIDDTANWVKLEGSFVANGTENFITIGNFFSKASTTAIVTNYWSALLNSWSYYLIDDVSVIPIDLTADAGMDTWVEQGKKVQIGRVGDTTAIGLDCKWYHKGALIDSGAIINVNANSVKHAIDTYVVVQTICGVVKSDTVNVFTSGLGELPLLRGARAGFSVYPNPSNGNISISPHAVIPTKEGTVHATVYDLLGREVYQSSFNTDTTIQLNTARGTYILELKDTEGNIQRERLVIE
jgi:hypothetical protein